MGLKGRIADPEARADELSVGGGASLLRVETWDDEIYTDMDSGQVYTHAEPDERVTWLKQQQLGGDK
jgi:hypothetical protein